MAANNIIDTGPKRNRLESRREPYWAKLSQGRFIGFRKTPASGSWIARHGKKQAKLGPESDYTYVEACAEANKWFEDIGRIGNNRYTLRAVFDHYINGLSGSKKRETQKRLDRNVPEAMQDALVSSLKTVDIQKWLTSLVVDSDDPETVRKSKSTANRTLAVFRAALNLALKHDMVASGQAWKKVEPFKGVDSARKLFLTDEQVGRLLKATEGPFHDLVKAAILTGARYGELRAAIVSDLDLTQGTLHLDGKTGPRETFLSDEGLAFFRSLARTKLPKAPLLPNPDGGHWGQSQHGRSMDAAKRKARLPADAVFYSLRHFHISKALIGGVNLMVVARNTGTSVLMIQKHYAKFLNQDVRDMFNAVELGL